MKDASNSVPKRCSCGRKLPRPQYGWPWSHEDKVLGRWYDYDTPLRHKGEKMWFIECQCNLRIIWSFPCNWVVRSKDPLFDSHEVIG